MEVVAGLAIAGLLFLLWRKGEQAGRDQDTFLRAITLSIESNREQVSEMATRIQHPEIVRPDIEPSEPGPPPVPDPAFERAGRIFPENGDIPEDE